MSLFPHHSRYFAGLIALVALPTLGAGADEDGLTKFRREVQPTLEKYCYECHGDGAEKGGIKLDGFENPADLRNHKLWLNALRNVRSHIMPPADADQPSAEEAQKLMAWIKKDGLELNAQQPDPGRVTVRRLNRVEYRNTIRELTGVEFDTEKEFPADDTGHGFDNIADVLTISPMLLEKYLDAAQSIVAKIVPMQSRVVAEKPIFGREFKTLKVDTTIPEAPKPVTSPETPAADATPAVDPAAIAVLANVGAGAPAAPAGAAPGVPQGRRGGNFPGRGPQGPPPMTRPAPTVSGDAIDLSYYTPAVVAAPYHVEVDGNYEMVVDLRANETYRDNLFDLNRCRLIVRDGEEVLLDQEFLREGAKEFQFKFARTWKTGDRQLSLEVVPTLPSQIQYRALRFRVSAVTIRGPLEEKYWVKPKGYEKVFPRDVPADVAGRREYARELLGKFATKAFRHPADAANIDRLVAVAEGVYSQPRNTFEAGVAQGMVAALAAPAFLFREENTEPLQSGQVYPLLDEYALASRLSYFFWSSMPDDELIKLAGEKKLRANLSAQVTRMLADKRSGEFIRNFTGQWLQARDIGSVQLNAMEIYLRDHPNPEYEEGRAVLAKPRESRTAEENQRAQAAQAFVRSFTPQQGGGRGGPTPPRPQMSPTLRTAMLRETEMTFEHILKDDRSVLELLESNYTFLNEELAKHYGVEGVTGSQMRKVELPPDSPRGGVLTQGTVLAVTSNPTRTSPVKRGVFILGTILGTPPAPPPPNIPPLEDAASAEELRSLNLRETLALHAKKPVCASCHSRMDPLGLALENFNAMGMWRTSDMGHAVEPGGKLITGETFSDIRELKHILATSHRQDFYQCLTEKLLTYALGRGVEYYDTITLDQIVAQLEASGGRPSVLINAIVNSAPFQQRRPLQSVVSHDDSHSTRVPSQLVQARP